MIKLSTVTIRPDSLRGHSADLGSHGSATVNVRSLDISNAMNRDADHL